MTTASTDPGHWFWRGVQSAIFYYVSCSPCIEYRHKQRRREEARAARAVVTQQPGVVPRPVAFQTNEQWGEELLLGPGPPKPYKPDNLVQRLRDRLATEPASPDKPERPGMERRISSAVENMKESLRMSINPDKWNWKRYDREDEVLEGFGDKMTRMWDRVTNIGHHDEQEPPVGRKRAHTNESERYDYSRGRIPAVNDLHPPVVSQLPATREQAAWMLLPPPSAAVMAGKKRPHEDQNVRKPLCIIGRPPPLPPPPPEKQTDRPALWEQQRYDSQESHNMDGDTEVGEGSIRKHQRHQSAPLPFPTKAMIADRLLPQLRPAKLDLDPDFDPSKAESASLVDVYDSKSRPPDWQFHYIIPTQ